MAQEAYSGVIWTDAHGVATVTLFAHMEGELTVELEALTNGVSARLAAEPGRRRFTITTSEPHVKVAWRASTRRPRAATQSPEEAR